MPAEWPVDFNLEQFNSGSKGAVLDNQEQTCFNDRLSFSNQLNLIDEMEFHACFY